MTRSTAIIAATFAAAMAATTVSTPLYPGYVAAFGLTSLDVTIVFAMYGLAVMCSLALFGRLSDHFGRKPPLAAGLVLGVAAMAVFIAAHGLYMLLLGRVLIGLTAGVYTGTATAWLVDLDTDRARATKVAIAANLGGLGLGPLIAGVLAAYVRSPLRTVYAVELVALAVGLVAHARMPETVARERFELDLGGVRPPPELRAVFIPAATAGIAAFGTSGVFGSTGPAMLRSVFDVDSTVAAGVLLALAFGAAVAGQLTARRFQPTTALIGGCVGLAVAVGLLALALEAAVIAALIGASLLSGFAMGVIVGAGLGLLTASAPPERRGQIASAYFLAVYAGLVVPVVGFGLVETATSLITAGLIFSCLVGAASLASALAISHFSASVAGERTNTVL